ncbi:MAG: hypothetical protein KDJ18_11435 [Hyphomicrobiaceae bacterium]|nr:hypothetical protein [Hyphomicrobiaceae bacterium]
MTDTMLTTMLHCSTVQADTLVAAYGNEHGWHAQTVIAAAGALLGHAIQASAYSMATQGTCDVSEFARQTNPPFGKFVRCGDRIQLFFTTELDFVLTVAEQLDWFPREAVPDVQRIFVDVIDQIDGDWFPRLGVASEHQPREWSPDAVPRFLRKMRAHLDHYNLSHNVCEVLCQTLALGYLVSAARDQIDPHTALHIGLEMAVATANIGNLDRTYFYDENEEEADGFATSMAATFALEEIDAPAPVHDTPAQASTQNAGSAGQTAKTTKVAFKETAPVATTIPLSVHTATVAPALHDFWADDSEDDPIALYSAPKDFEPLTIAGVNTADESELADATDAEDADLGDEDEIDDLPAPRASRLARPRPNKTAFGKRQLA